MGRFTLEQYRDMERWLVSHGIFDADFDISIAEIGEDDTVVIVQNGKNVRIRVIDLLNTSDKFKGLMDTEEMYALNPSLLADGDYVHNSDTRTIWRYESGSWVDTLIAFVTELPDNLLIADDPLVTPSTSDVTITIKTLDDPDVDLVIPAATNLLAGVLSTTDYSRLNSAYTISGIVDNALDTGDGIYNYFEVNQSSPNQVQFALDYVSNTYPTGNTTIRNLLPVSSTRSGVVDTTLFARWENAYSISQRVNNALLNGDGIYYNSNLTHNANNINLALLWIDSTESGTTNLVFNPVNSSQAGIVTPAMKLEWDNPEGLLKDIVVDHETNRVVITFSVTSGDSLDDEVDISVQYDTSLVELLHTLNGNVMITGAGSNPSVANIKLQYTTGVGSPQTTGVVNNTATLVILTYE